jgi:hypothetical protein
MKIIKLTSHKDASFIYVNINEIGHFNEVKESQMWHQGEPISKKHTVIGVTTHNNGGFKVKETPEEIIEKIRRIRNLSSTYIII